MPIFLISLKAGGTGLNLTRADTVIHYDPWWNPAVEDQATDRAHRIGQDKTVFVYKLIAAGTVEEKMVELQGKKQALVDGVLSGTAAGLELHRGRHRGPVRAAAGVGGLGGGAGAGTGSELVRGVTDCLRSVTAVCQDRLPQSAKSSICCELL